MLSVCGLMAFACTDYKAQINQLQEDISNLEVSIAELGSVADNLGVLRDVLTIGSYGDPVKSVTPAGDSFTFEFINNGTKKVHNNTAGISVGYADGGGYFWTLGGEPLKDASGRNASIKVSPKFRAKDGKREVSTDGGKTWAQLPSSPEGVISKVEDNATDITVTFLGGTVAVFDKEPVITVMISGDGSTISSQGRVILDYYISGGSGEYTVVTSQPGGWSPRIVEENSFKGQIDFVSSGNPDSNEVIVYVCDTDGHMTATRVDLAALTPYEQFPQMFPVYDAYNVGCNGGNVEVTVNTNLEYDIEMEASASSWLTMTGTKAVRQDKIAFSATVNESFSIRSAEITLTSGAYVKKVWICQDGQMPSIGQNLSEKGTANCYIVPSEGDYWFDATVIGNGQQGIIEDAGFHTESAASAPASVDILTEFNEGTELLENLRLEDGKICFHATGAKGNLTVITFDENGAIAWTWHLWFTDIPLDKTHTCGYEQFTLMDRNLGAISADPEDGEDTYGLYYQWGRKDPFAGEDILTGMTTNSAGTLAYAMTRPFRPLKTAQAYAFNWMAELNDSLWGNPDTRGEYTMDQLVKTIYDPCPPGYMVPPVNTYLIFNDKTRLQFITNGIVLRGDYGQTSFYPYAGRVYQGDWEAFGHHPDEIYMTLWNSAPAIYNTSVFDGGATVTFRVSKIQMSVNIGDFRSRGIPVRCLKQR